MRRFLSLLVFGTMFGLATGASANDQDAPIRGRINHAAADYGQLQ